MFIGGYRLLQVCIVDVCDRYSRRERTVWKSTASRDMWCVCLRLSVCVCGECTNVCMAANLLCWDNMQSAGSGMI